MPLPELDEPVLRAVPRTPPSVSLRRLESLVSPLTGIVASTAELMRMTDDARLVRISAVVADQEPLVGTALDNHPGGIASNRSAALAAALGEAAERYAASFLPADRLVHGAASEVEGAVPAGRFALFSTAQYAEAGFPFVPFTDETAVAWVDGVELPSGAPIRVPAQLVFMSFAIPDELDEPRIGYTTSNGLACAATREEAVLAALFELLERDAFMIVWENRLSLPLLDWSGSTSLSAAFGRYYAPTGLAVHAVDLSAFWDVPTVAAVVRGGDDGAHVGVGAAAAATVEEAWSKAVAEAFAVRSWARTELFEGDVRAFADDFSDVTSFADHIALHADPANGHMNAFLDASPDRRAVAEIGSLPARDVLQTIEAICARLERRGLRAYAVDVTTPDLRQAGLHVVKAVVPELCALSSVHLGRFLGGTRLYSAAAEAGLAARPLEAAELNPYPHPFP